MSSAGWVFEQPGEGQHYGRVVSVYGDGYRLKERQPASFTRAKNPLVATVMLTRQAGLCRPCQYRGLADDMPYIGIGPLRPAAPH
jgi:hypothetical protein